MAKQRSSLFGRLRARRNVQRSKGEEIFVVLYWPDPTHHVPELRGPYYSIERGLEVRNAIRARQRREEKMAQLSPLVHWNG